MADTIPNITLTDEWQDIYAITGIDIGKAISVENIGSETCELHISSTKPASRPNNVGANSLYPLVTKYISATNSGLWARNKPNKKETILQVGLTGGISTTKPLTLILFPSLSLRIDPIEQQFNDKAYVLVRNRTSSPMLLEQLMNYESFSLGASDGTSLMSLSIYFNPDLTGSITGLSKGKAYSNSREGDFIDITGIGIDILDLQGFNPVNTPDFLKITSGSISFFSIQASTGIAVVNNDKVFIKKIIIQPAGKFVIANDNTPLINGGTETTTSMLFTGKFADDPVIVLPPPESDFTDEFTNDFN